MQELPKILVYLLFLEITVYIPLIFIKEKNIDTHLENVHISLGDYTNKTLLENLYIAV